MIELPEAVVIARQINETIYGKKIKKVVAAKSPHRFAWYYEDPNKYDDLLAGKKVGDSDCFGGWIEIKIENVCLSFCEGINLGFHKKNEERPQKHQLLMEFGDLTAVSATVQMYGGIYCYRQGQFDNEYYLKAKEKPSPLSVEFDWEYFIKILSSPDIKVLSAKAFLATNQRIPGLGNGVLQDILFNAKIHPKRKVSTFTGDESKNLFDSLKSTLEKMASRGGRETEKDFFGNLGGYKTKVGKNTAGTNCRKCGEVIKKETYMGGSIYYCTGCQKL